MIASRIRHTVAFTLVHPEGSAEERYLLESAERLAAVACVEAFELLAEMSPKNGYRFGSRWSLPIGPRTTALVPGGTGPGEGAKAPFSPPICEQKRIEPCK